MIARAAIGSLFIAGTAAFFASSIAAMIALALP